MASRFAMFCDAVLGDLTTYVPGLQNVTPHRLASWDPEQLLADGDRHLAVFPAAEAVEEAARVVTGPGGDVMVDLYRVLYWEPADDEPSRGVADEQAAQDLYELLEAVVDRFYAVQNVFLGGTELTEYAGCRLPDRSGTTRWFQVSLRGRRSIIVS